MSTRRRERGGEHASVIYEVGRAGIRMRSRRGSTIVLALGALVLLGIVVAALAVMVTATARDATSARAMDDAQVAAENAVATLQAEWNAKAVSHASGGVVAVTAVGDIDLAVRALLLPAGVVRLAAEASSMGAVVPAARARRVAQLYLRHRPPPLDPLAAMLASGPVIVGAGSMISGADLTALPGCVADGTMRAALVVDDLTTVSMRSGAAISGLPTLAAGAAAPTSSILAAVEALTPPTLRLASSATGTIFGPTFDAGGCALDDALVPAAINAGDPDGVSSCAAYRPYIHVAGDLIAPTGRGQGVLRVDGDLRVAGDFRWAGLIVVYGAVELVGPAVAIHGLVVAGGGGSSSHALEGAVLVARSACAVHAALTASSYVTPLTGAAWAGLP